MLDCILCGLVYCIIVQIINVGCDCCAKCSCLLTCFHRCGSGNELHHCPNNAVNQQLNRPGVLWTSWAGVDREASRDDGRQELVTSQAVNREWRRETGSEPDTAQPSHSYKQHGTVPCDSHTDSNNSTVPWQDHTHSSSMHILNKDLTRHKKWH